MAQDFSGGNVTTAQYQVLFVKRDYESILQDSQTVVTQDMGASGFVAWQTANFTEEMATVGIQLSSQAFDTLRDLPGAEWRPPRPAWKPGVHPKLVGLSSDDNQYLRVEFQILGELEREDANYDEDQTKALESIARSLGRPDACSKPEKQHNLEFNKKKSQAKPRKAVRVPDVKKAPAKKAEEAHLPFSPGMVKAAGKCTSFLQRLERLKGHEALRQSIDDFAKRTQEIAHDKFESIKARMGFMDDWIIGENSRILEEIASKLSRAKAEASRQGLWRHYHVQLAHFLLFIRFRAADVVAESGAASHIETVINQAKDLRSNFKLESVSEIREFLRKSPLHADKPRLDQYFNNFRKTLK